MQEQDQPGDDEDAGGDTDRQPARERLQLCGDLRLGQLDLLADEQLGLVGDLVDGGDDVRL